MRRAIIVAAILCGCPAAKSSSDAGMDAGSVASDSGSGNPDGGVAGIGLFARLEGLWSGQAAQTPLGSFPEMNMDFRAADSHWMFGRVDLDSADSLRYGFAVETVNGAPTLVYRNGGYFHGVERDSDTVLMDADEVDGTYHFCAEQSGCFFSVDGGCLPVSGGCGFIDALFSFSDATHMVFNAHVNGAEHLIWTVTRQETRTIATPFPSDSTALATDAGWPDLPTLDVTISWTTPLAAATDVWAILSTTPCASLTSTAFTCNPSREISGSAAAGTTSITLEFDQILPGTYNAIALVDIAGGFATTLSPQPGDEITNPSATVTVPASGTGTGSLSVVYTVP